MAVLANIGSAVHTLDWRGWLLGIWSAFIVGFTGAVGSAGGGAAIGVQGLRNYFVLMGASGLTCGVVSLAAYLHNHPAPAPWDGVTERRTQAPQ